MYAHYAHNFRLAVSTLERRTGWEHEKCQMAVRSFNPLLIQQVRSQIWRNNRKSWVWRAITRWASL